MMDKNLKFDSKRNRFEKVDDKIEDSAYMSSRSDLYVKRKESPSIKGIGYYMFLLVVFVVAYLLFSNYVFV
ncbi:MAG: hypothetical protein U9N85_07620 [Bacteroidota bacterium]|nr:hypothetical protein [Bacteroidota bacterium]